MSENNPTRTDPPNVVLCVMDDHQFDALGFLGHPMAKTPFLDELAARGVHFANAFMPGGSYAAVCMPSRAMLHSGRTLFHIEGIGRTIPETHPTLGERLRSVGYDTFHTGKWHNDRASLHRSFTEADEVFLGGMDDPWNAPLLHHDPTGAYEGTLPGIWNPLQSNAVRHRPGDHVYPGRHSTDIFCDRAARYIGDHSGERPFFLSLALMAPHDPRTAPPEYHEAFPAEDAVLPPNFMPRPEVDTGALTIRDEVLAAQPRDADEVRRHLADYHAMIHHLDEGLGRVMRAIEEANRAENTVFIFTADHGLALGQHGLMGKQDVYEHSIRVPLIAAGPGIPAGVARHDEVLHLDLYRTLLDLAGADRSDGADSVGLRLTESAGDAATLPPERGYFAYAKSIRSIRVYPYKLIEYAHGDYRATELFDLSTDPGETHNLADSAEHADRLAAMRKRLEETADAVGDTDTPLGEAFWSCYHSHL